MNNVAFDCAIHGRTKSDRGSASLLSIASGGGLLDALGESLEAGLSGLVTRSIPVGFASGFECGLGIGHGG